MHSAAAIAALLAVLLTGPCQFVPASSKDDSSRRLTTSSDPGVAATLVRRNSENPVKLGTPGIAPRLDAELPPGMLPDSHLALSPIRHHLPCATLRSQEILLQI
jgi:hypothetical protein